MEAQQHWSPAARIAFRFCFVYLGLYSLATQIVGSLILIPGVSFRGLGWLWPFREITMWIGLHVFSITSPLVFSGNSRDTDFYWIQMLWLLVVSLLVTVAWSVLDQSRPNYASLNKWFRVFIRLALASQMFEYGMTKIIPTQFPAPSLVTLVTRVGNVPLQGLLWTSVGAAPAYAVFTGVAELLGGILLIIPRTTTLGALICLADLTQVFVLNLTYDIGVKQISFHLILLTLFLLAADVRRLAGLFANRPTRPSTHAQLFLTPKANRTALAAQILIGVYLLAMQADTNWVFWHLQGGGRVKSPLYGIWDVKQLSVNGEVQPAGLNDYNRRWRRVLFDLPDQVVFQRTDDSFSRYGAVIDEPGKTFALTKGESKTWKSIFAFQRPAEDRLLLNGEMDGYRIELQLQRVEFDTLRLLNSDFRWVRPVE